MLVTSIFSPFPTLFSTLPKTCLNFSWNLFCCLQVHSISPSLKLSFSRVIPFPNKPWFFTRLLLKSFENTVENEEIARVFSPFPTAVSIHLEIFLPFSLNLKVSSANSLSLKEECVKKCFE